MPPWPTHHENQTGTERAGVSSVWLGALMQSENYWAEAAQLVVAWHDHRRFLATDRAGDDSGLEKFIDVLEMLPAVSSDASPVESDLRLLQYLNQGLQMGFASHHVLLDAIDATMDTLSDRIAPPAP